MELFFLILCLISLQIFLGIRSRYIFLKSQKEFQIITLSDKNVSDILELYSLEYPKLDMRVEKQLDQPFVGLDNLVLIDKNYLYKNDLFSLVLLIWELEISKTSRKTLRILPRLLNLVFFLQFLPLFLLLPGLEYLTLIGLILVLILQALIFSTIFLLLKICTNFKDQILEVISVVLNFDDLDEERSKILLDRLVLKYLDFPLDIWIKFRGV